MSILTLPPSLPPSLPPFLLQVELGLLTHPAYRFCFVL
jgi:hypothetical protein